MKTLTLLIAVLSMSLLSACASTPKPNKSSSISEKSTLQMHIYPKNKAQKGFDVEFEL